MTGQQMREFCNKNIKPGNYNRTTCHRETTSSIVISEGKMRASLQVLWDDWRIKETYQSFSKRSPVINLGDSYGNTSLFPV